MVRIGSGMWEYGYNPCFAVERPRIFFLPKQYFPKVWTWTFNKKKYCELCGHNPWEHPKVKLIDDELIKDRVAWGMLFVDHIETQRDGGSHCDQNTQTLCLDCNMIKSTLAGDMVPKKLYKDKKEYYKVLERLKPHYNKVFNQSS